MLGSLLCIVPIGAQAAITFSEVAWMGGVTSANHEWIELHNDGEAIDVANWKISDGMNLDVPLAGTIGAGETVVLERTSDDTVSGAAFLIYTGALVNTGATLSIKRSDGSLEDQVSGGENWQNIGGDNVTKETAQYTKKGWVTASPTPGRVATEAEATTKPPENVETTPLTTSGKNTAAASRKSSGETVRLVLPERTLQLKIDAQAVAYVHQPITLSVTSSGVGDTLIASLKYEWNFGDGTTATGQEVTHEYAYPGTYVVTSYGGFKRQAQVARQEITILPVEVSLTTNTAGDVQVNNDSPYELDLSGYQITSSKRFMFPPRSIILPGQTITVPRQKVAGRVGEPIAIKDTAGATVATLFKSNVVTAMMPETTDLAVAPIVSATTLTPVLSGPENRVEEFSFTNTAEAAVAPMEMVVAVQEETVPIQAAAPLPANNRWPYVALAATILLATLGLYLAPRRNEIV